MKVYLAGPMRGIVDFNFPAFDAARDDLVAQGYVVISPADLDREAGFDPRVDSMEKFDLDAARRRDLEAVMSVDELVLLPGWRNSKGAKAEVALAAWCDIPVREYGGDPPSKPGVLEEAIQLTRGDRQAAYGPPDQDFVRTAAMWTPLLGVEVSSKQVALCMIALKLSRETHQSKRDNWVDIGGYARCGAICDGHE